MAQHHEDSALSKAGPKDSYQGKWLESGMSVRILHVVCVYADLAESLAVAQVIGIHDIHHQRPAEPNQSANQ